MAFGLKHDASNPDTFIQGNLAIAFIIITWPFVILRFYVRYFMVKKLMIDDLFILIAQVLYTAYCVLGYMSVILVPGVRASNRKDGITALNVILSSILISIMTTITLKLSLGFFYVRILVKPLHRTIAYVAMILNTIACLIALVFIFVDCGGPKNYAVNMMKKKCISWTIHSAIFYQQTIANIIVDCILIFLPISSLQHSTLDIWSKLTVLFIFALAGSGTICTLLRIIHIHTVAPDHDHVTERIKTAIYSIIEPGVFIVAGCLATMRPLVTRAFPVLATSNSRHSSKLNTYSEGSDLSTDARNSSVAKPEGKDEPWIG